MYITLYISIYMYMYVQTSLQSVVGTAAAASFADDLYRWQKQLQTIEAVLGMWLRVQALWVQLEVRKTIPCVFNKV